MADRLTSPPAPPANTEKTKYLMYTLIEGKLYGSAFPLKGDLADFHDRGIELMVSLTCRQLGADMRNSLHAMEIDYLHEPVADFTPPALPQMDRIYSAYRKTVTRGGAVLIHCGAGKGRTGTVLACIIGAEKKLSAGAAIERVRSARPDAVETSEQEQFVAHWLDRHTRRTRRRRGSA